MLAKFSKHYYQSKYLCKPDTTLAEHTPSKPRADISGKAPVVIVVKEGTTIFLEDRVDF